MTTYMELEALQRKQAEMDRAVKAGEKELSAAEAVGDPRGIAEARRRLARVRAISKALTAELEKGLDGTIDALDPGVPLLLLPVRLETRYNLDLPTPRLRIRVYPDEIHLDAHEPELTPIEADAGRTFWKTCWNAAPDERERAWQELVVTTGTERGAWVVQVLRPRNSLDDEAPDFPAPTLHGGRWTRATQARLLPDRWRAGAWRAGTRIAVATGRLIRRPLAAGLDPAFTDSDDLVDTEMRWMTDFAGALDVGMGLIMELPDLDRIDLLTVVGVRGTQDAAAGAGEVADLLAAHRYGPGLGLLRAGAPTNNSEADRSAHGLADPTGAGRDHDPSATPRAPSGDSELLRAALGVPDSALADLPVRQDVRLEGDMATVLWPATWKYYLTQMLRLDGLESFQPVFRRWALDTVRGGGPLPTLRVGAQPYGVLPATALDRWRPMPGAGSAGVVSVELVRPRSVQPPRLEPPVTRVRVLGGMDDRAQWTFLGPDDLSLPTPATATLVAAAAADLDGDGLPELVIAHAVEPGPATVAARLVTARLREDGLETLAEIALQPPGARLPNRPLRGLALALGHVTSEDSSAPFDIIVVLQYQPELAGARPQTFLVLGKRLAESKAEWSVPVNVSTQITADERVTSAAILPQPDGSCHLVVVTEDDQATTGSRPARWHIAHDLDADGVPDRWSPPQPVGSPRGANRSDAGSAVAIADLAGAPHALLAQYRTLTDGSAAAGYVVGQDMADGSFGWPQGRWVSFGEVVRPGAGQLLGGALCWVPWTPFGETGRGLRTAAAQVNLLRRLRDLWRRASADVARVVPGDPDPYRTVLDVLAADAVSTRVDSRAFVGTRVLANTWHVLGLDGSTGTPAASAGVEAILADLGLHASLPPRLGEGGYGTATAPITETLTGAAPTEPLPWLRDMLTATPAELHGRWIGADVPLLARVVRHSLLQAYADAAFALVPTGTDPPPLPEPELVDLPDLAAKEPVRGPTLTSWRHLSTATFGGQPVADVLYGLAQQNSQRPEVRELVETLGALQRLIGQPAGVLERTLGSVLDVASHRLDAWLTAVATQRLRDLRSSIPGGLHTGGFGFVCDLQPASAPLSTGYIHAPSMTHATTAAVLRSGYLSHDGGQLAVDLSSGRVRAALNVLAAVREGQSLGAALGYRFERLLHDRRLGQYLSAVRQLAPLDVGTLTPVPDGVDVTVIAPTVTTDGLVLLASSQDTGMPWGSTPPGQKTALPPEGSNDHAAMTAALKTVADIADTIADIGTAESVYQLVLRNPARAAGTLDALAHGEAPASPDPDVLRTPRLGTGVNHRLLLAIPAPDEPAAAAALSRWPATATQRARHVRAAAEPRLNAWAALILGDPQRVKYRVIHHDPVTGHPDGHPMEFSLADVGLCPYDVLASSAPSIASLAESNLGRRMLRHASSDRPSTLLSGRASDWAVEVLSIEELLTLAQSARVLVRSSRAADNRDLSVGGSAHVDEDEVAARAETAREGLASAVEKLRTYFGINTDVQRAALAMLYPGPDSAVDNLLDLPQHLDIAPAATAVLLPDLARAHTLADTLELLSGYGISDAAARAQTGADEADRAAFAVQARATAVQATQRLTAAVSETTKGTHLGTLEAIFGEGFRALPVFTNTQTQTLSPDGATPAAVEVWFDGVAQVREDAARLQELLLGSEPLGTGPADWDVIQTPATEPWVGLPIATGAKRIPAGCVSVVFATTTRTWRSRPQVSALAVDSWVDTVPEQEETTAITFHLNSPDAAPPQAALLALSPDPAVRWTWETLSDVVLETIDLARLRAVGPEDVPVLGHVLPTSMLAHNVGGDPAGDTISTMTKEE